MSSYIGTAAVVVVVAEEREAAEDCGECLALGETRFRLSASKMLR